MILTWKRWSWQVWPHGNWQLNQYVLNLCLSLNFGSLLDHWDYPASPSRCKKPFCRNIYCPLERRTSPSTQDVLLLVNQIRLPRGTLSPAAEQVSQAKYRKASVKQPWPTCVETGRYRKNQSQSPPSKTDRACRFCHSIDNIYWLEQLPFFEDPILENEVHVVTECPGYHNIRLTLSDNLKSLIMLRAFSTIMTSHHAAEFGKYLTDSQRLRKSS